MFFGRIISSSTSDFHKEIDRNLHEVKEIGKVSPELDFHRMISIPNANSVVTLNEMGLSFWNVANKLKKKSSYPVPRLAFSSQNIAFVPELNLVIVSLSYSESSIFRLEKKPRLICKSPISLPYNDYLHSMKTVVSFGNDMLSIWGIINKKIYCKAKGSFHTAKYLNGLDKLATFEGLFCELYVYDIDREKKGLANRKLLYSNDNTFGCLNQLDWLEKRKILQTIKLNNEAMLLTWSEEGSDDSYILDLKKFKAHALKQKIGKVCFYSAKAKSFVTCKEDKLYLWKF